MSGLDYIFLGILAFAVFRGYKRGFFASLAAVVGYIAGLIGTVVLYQPLSAFLNSSADLPQKLMPLISEKLALPVSNMPINKIAIDQAVEMVNRKELPQMFKTVMLRFVEDFSKLPAMKGINTLGEGVAYMLSTLIIKALIFSMLFFCITAVFRIVLPKLFKTVSPKPVKIIDQLGGAVLGLCVGILSIAMLVVVLVPIASMGALKGNPSPLGGLVHGSLITNLLLSRMEVLLNTVFSGGGI